MEQEATYQLYCHTNLVNGKMYFGVTKNSWEERWKTKYKYNLHFYRAIKKYGEDDWSHEIIKDGLTRKQAAEWEKAYIGFFNTDDNKYGYNKGRGGEGVNPLDSLYAKQHSQEYHDALSKAMKGVWANRTREDINKLYSQEYRERLSQHSRKLWATKEYRDKISAYHAAKREERLNSPEYQELCKTRKNQKREYQKKYHAEHYQPVPSDIKRRNYSMAQKLLWQTEGHKEKMSAAFKGRIVTEETRKKIRAARTGTEHSETEISAISKGMKEKWQDADYRTSLCKPKSPRTEESKIQTRQQFAEYGRTVLCVETNITYPSINEAARSLGVDVKHLKKEIKQGHRVKGFHYQIIGDIKPPERKCFCVETGAEYSSLKDAERVVGVKASSISQCCRGARKTAGGYHWKYIE